jgi:hypothetical protein
VERILFGDNQFFGVNHMSEEKARAQAAQFKDTAAIMKVLDDAYDVGLKVFMCTTHDRVGEIADLVRANPTRYKDFTFYPCMPYAHKYANSVGEVGILETLKRFAPGSLVGTLIQGAMSVVTQDIYRLMKMLVDAEMKRFAGLKTPIGLKLYDVFPAFAQHIRDKYDAEAGFITMNLPKLVEVLEGVGVKNPIVCANINKIGFRMSGGIDSYRQVLSSGRCRAIAMSVFASGAIPPAEAIDWVCGVEGVQSILFGASSAGNIRRTKELIDKAWGPAPAAR